MSASAQLTARDRFALDLSDRGYHVLFHRDEANRCAGCGNSRWLVGRVTAECVSCGTALPLGEGDHARFDPLAQEAVAFHVVQTVKPANSPAEKRVDERVRADGRVLGLIVDGSPHAFSVRNISVGGLMGDAVPDIAEARTIEVELEDGTLIPAELRWTDGELVGVAFVKPARRGLWGLLGLASR